MRVKLLTYKHLEFLSLQAAQAHLSLFRSKCHIVGNLMSRLTCADLESFARGGPILTTFFFFFFSVDKWRKDPNTTISGPPSAHHQNAIKIAFCWHADVSPTLNAGLTAFDFSGDPDQYY